MFGFAWHLTVLLATQLSLNYYPRFITRFHVFPYPTVYSKRNAHLIPNFLWPPWGRGVKHNVKYNVCSVSTEKE